MVAHLVGRKTPDDLIHAICGSFTLPGYTDEQTRADVEVMLAGARAKWGEETFDQVDQSAQVEDAMPLRREMPPAAAFPIDALGPILGNAAHGIHDVIQAPLAMCGQSVLGAAALAAQGHVDVTLPTQQVRPSRSTCCRSLPRATARPPAMRRPCGQSASMSGTCEPHFDKQLPAWQDAFELWKSRSATRSSRPSPPTSRKEPTWQRLGPRAAPAARAAPAVRAEPTIEGLIKLFPRGYPALGLVQRRGRPVRRLVTAWAPSTG